MVYLCIRLTFEELCHFLWVVRSDGIWICEITFYIISCIMHGFWLVLTYDLLEDRRTNDVIASNFIPLFFSIKWRKVWTFRGNFTRLGERRHRKKVLPRLWTNSKGRKKKKTRFFVENDLGCVPLGWSRSGSVIQDHSDHGASKEPKNPFWVRISRFLWCAMIWVILDHWSWSGSSQRNAGTLKLEQSQSSATKQNTKSFFII